MFAISKKIQASLRSEKFLDTPLGTVFLSNRNTPLKYKDDMHSAEI